jgi:hypothetical protein
VPRTPNLRMGILLICEAPSPTRSGGAASFAPSKGAVFDFQLSRGSKSNKLSRSRTWVPHTRFMRVGIVTWDRPGLAFDLALDFDIA